MFRLNYFFQKAIKVGYSFENIRTGDARIFVICFDYHSIEFNPIVQISCHRVPRLRANPEKVPDFLLEIHG